MTFEIEPAPSTKRLDRRTALAENSLFSDDEGSGETVSRAITNSGKRRRQNSTQFGQHNIAQPVVTVEVVHMDRLVKIVFV